VPKLIDTTVTGGSPGAEYCRAVSTEQDARARGDRVGPLDVQGRLAERPLLARRRGGRELRRVREALADLDELRVGQAEGAVEHAQVGGDVRVAVGVHDGDRLPGPVGGNDLPARRGEPEVEVVGLADEGRGERGRGAAVFERVEPEAGPWCVVLHALIIIIGRTIPGG
jgi:hypothetical protein